MSVKEEDKATENLYQQMKPRSPMQKWISHRNHLNDLVLVDHVFFLNPRDQQGDTALIPPLPCWTNVVFEEVMDNIKEKFEGKTLKEVFKTFDHNQDGLLSREEFKVALQQLGFTGDENSPFLTEEEVDVLLRSADQNQDGVLDYPEFYERFWIAVEELQEKYDRKSYEDDVIIFSDSFSLISSSTNEQTASVPRHSNATNPAILKDLERFTFARSNFLTSASIENNAKVPLDENQERAKVYITSQHHHHQKLEEVISLGSLQVQDFRLLPESLKSGLWPDNYTLSDHGMIECILLAEINL